MLKKLKERLPEMSEPNIPNSVVPIFRQLVTYIDGGLAESYQKEGDERAAQLVTHMLNLRDFMTRQVTENGLRQAIINEINSIMKELYNISPVKNKKVLNWRFVESPTKNYDIYLVKKKSKILGYYVSRITKMKNYNVLAIVDLFIKNHEENVIQAILNHVQRIGCDLEVDFIACMMNPKNPMITQFRKNILQILY